MYAIKLVNFRRELLNSIEPYEEERQVCATLLSFLGKMELQTPSTPSSCYSSYANTPSEHFFPFCTHALPQNCFTSIWNKNLIIINLLHFPNSVSPDEPKSPLPTVRDDAEDKLLSGMESLYCGIPRRSSKKVKRSGSKASQFKVRPKIFLSLNYSINSKQIVTETSTYSYT
jgi:hypothetical protein